MGFEMSIPCLFRAKPARLISLAIPQQNIQGPNLKRPKIFGANRTRRKFSLLNRTQRKPRD